jgi:hypothetical protein
MKLKFLERLVFKLSGRSVPVVRVSDIDVVGKIHSIQFRGKLKKRDNSIVATWDATGYEIRPGHTMVTIIDEKDTSENGYIVSESGRAVDLYTEPRIQTNVESVVGKFATADDIADNMDLQKSMRYLLIGGVFSAPVWWIVFQVLGALMK